MAKKAKIKKTKKRKQPKPLVTVSEGWSPHVGLSEEVRRECETVRFLSHYAVDRLCDCGCHKQLLSHLGSNLGGFCADVVHNYMTDLIHEARGKGKGVRGG